MIASLLFLPNMDEILCILEDVSLKDPGKYDLILNYFDKWKDKICTSVSDANRILEQSECIQRRGSLLCVNVGNELIKRVVEIHPCSLRERYSHSFVKHLVVSGEPYSVILTLLFTVLSLKKQHYSECDFNSETSFIYEAIAESNWDFSPRSFPPTTQLLLCRLLICFPCQESASQFRCVDIAAVIVSWVLSFSSSSAHFSQTYIRTMSTVLLSLGEGIDATSVINDLIHSCGLLRNEPTVYWALLIVNVCKGSKKGFDCVAHKLVERMGEDEGVALFFQRSANWIGLPDMPAFVSSLLRELGKSHRLGLFGRVCDVIVDSYPRCLYIKNMRLGSLVVLKTVLLCDQSSPTRFHRLLAALTEKLKLFMTDDSEDISFNKALAQLLYILMFRFSGNDALYSELGPFMQRYPPPSEEYARKLLYSQCLVNTTFDVGDARGILSRKMFPHLCGLMNEGNTCYANSVVQLLYQSDSFVSLLASAFEDSASRNILRQSIPFELYRIFSFLYLTERGSVSLDELLKHFLPSWFEVGEQQDSSEYLKYLLSCTEESFLKLNCRSPTDCFKGQLNVSYSCGTCERRMDSKESFFDLPVHFERGKKYDESKVSQLLMQTFESELLSNCVCETCGSIDSTCRKVSVQDAPACLIVSLNRFGYDTLANRRFKFQDVVLPEKTLSIHCVGNDGNESRVDYELYGMNIHRGASARYGHYFAIAMDATERKGRWVTLDDENVRSSTEGYDCSFDACETVYMLLYKTVNTGNHIDYERIFSKSSFRAQILHDNRCFQNELNKRQANGGGAGAFFSHDGRRDDNDDGETGGGSLGNGHTPFFIS